MGVNLRRGKIAVSQQHLHHAQIGAMVQQMRRKGVTQYVRRQLFTVDTRQCGVMLDAMPERLPRHLLGALAREQDVDRRTVEQPRTAVLQVRFQPVHRLFTQRYQPFLVTFTYHAHHALTQADIAHRQANQFRNAQAGSIQ